MKVRVQIQVDLESGDYDVRIDNLSQPGQPVPFVGLDQVVARVMENVAERATGAAAAAPVAMVPALLN